MSVKTTSPHDPYADNILIQGLGPIRSRQDAASSLVALPQKPPRDIASIPRHIRLHMLMDVRNLHIPSVEGLQLVESIDMMIRQNYHHLHPSSASTWSKISGEPVQFQLPLNAPVLISMQSEPTNSISI